VQPSKIGEKEDLEKKKNSGGVRGCDGPWSGRIELKKGELRETPQTLTRAEKKKTSLEKNVFGGGGEKGRKNEK